MFRTNNYFYQFLVSMLLLMFYSEASSAAPGRYNDWRSTVKSSGEVYISTGIATGKANELVYCQPSGCPVDYKLSQLIWEIKDVIMLEAGFSTTADDVTFNFDGKLRVTEGTGVMDDYDWLYLNRDWSDWSHHEDTRVTEGMILDLSLDFRLYAVSQTNLALVLGYKSETWGWESRGGSYIYSDTDNLGFRDQTGSFTPGRLSISYEQKFETPYIGLKFNTSLENWRFHARAIYSNMVDVSATDYHHLRDLTFKNSYEDGEMTAYNATLAYQFGAGFGLMARFDYQEYKEVRGGTDYSVTSTGANAGYCRNCAGTDNSTTTWSLGMLYEY
ncbi:MAG: omptin family outer membrane protease [Gammaproteobacteria bacterium]|nr:omptin family outer membrane protease [Gammaproteobacteria bacterium]